MRVEIEIAESGHLRPLAATCGHLRPLAGSGHLRPLAATRYFASFLSFHLFPAMRYFRPLVSSLISRSFLLPFRFNSSLPFALSFLLI